MRAVVRLTILGMTLILAAPAVHAQNPGVAYGAGGAFVVLAPNVQKELKFTDEQTGKVRTVASELGGKYRDQFMAVRDLPESERPAKVRSLSNTLLDDVKKALSMSPEQAKRYDQIVLQQRGLIAFTDPQIQKRLQLAEAQRQKLTELTVEARLKAVTIRKETGDDRAEAARQFKALREEYAAKALALLSGDQTKTWAELIGEPFEVKFEEARQ